MDFASEGVLMEEQKQVRKNKSKGDLESNGKYGKFNNEMSIDDQPLDGNSIHGRTSSSSTPPHEKM